MATLEQQVVKTPQQNRCFMVNSTSQFVLAVSAELTQLMTPLKYVFVSLVHSSGKIFSLKHVNINNCRPFSCFIKEVISYNY